MNTSNLLKLSVALAIGYFGAATADEGKDESGKGKKYPPSMQYPHDDAHGSYFHRHGYNRLNIPKGHYPPPGECRIWYPDRPAGHQPPPGKCHQLRTRVPLGAWLIRHPEKDSEHVHISVYDNHRPGTVIVTGEFEIGTSVFVRVVVDR
jgi:hypothetical protein